MNDHLQLRCDVVQDPFHACTRCKRIRLDCKIESNFKRVGKRSRNAEMEREIVELRKQLAQGTSQQPSQQTSPVKMESPLPSAGSVHSAGVTPMAHQPMTAATAAYISQAGQDQQRQQGYQDQYMGSNHEAVTSLMDLKSGLEGSYARNQNTPAGPPARRLEDVSISPQGISQLFEL